MLEVLSCCTVTGNLRGGRDHDQKDEKGDHSNNDKKEEARKPVTKRKMTSRRPPSLEIWKHQMGSRPPTVQRVGLVHSTVVGVLTREMTSVCHLPFSVVWM